METILLLGTIQNNYCNSNEMQPMYYFISNMDTIAILDFGGQYTHLIANRIRRLGVYSQIVQSNVSAEQCRMYKGIILSGGPHSVLEQGRPSFDAAVLSLPLPILGLCYGHQIMAQSLGSRISRGLRREYGVAYMNVFNKEGLFKGLDDREQIWMNHGDAVENLPEDFEALASNETCAITAMGNTKTKKYGLQFHPEVTDTPHGMKILDNFIELCQCVRDWNPRAFQKKITDDIRETCGSKSVFLLVSGGVDSTVTFTLLNNTLGPQRVMGLHIDNGLMRHGESDDIITSMKKHGFENLRIVNASDRFLTALRGVCEPEEKRRIIGSIFIDVQEQAVEDFGLNSDEWILGQGTIYPDTIESAGTQHADRIKTHHNRVEAIMDLLKKGKIVEPLSQLYKDEVRELGELLGLPEHLLWRHPFPGPGLGVRLLCSDGLEVPISDDTIKNAAEQAAAAGYTSTILPLRSVGVQGDCRTYAHPALVCGPKDWSRLEELSTAITNSVREINRVVYGLRVDGAPRYRIVKAFLTKERLDMLRAFDAVVTSALHRCGEYGSVWQMPVVLLPLVNERGNQCAVLRPILSQEAMTARFARLKDETLDYILDQSRSVKGIGDIFYDVTHKPPGTIEWE
jgi:GMP synthase (glutamine-hydrolysing)